MRYIIFNNDEPYYTCQLEFGGIPVLPPSQIAVELPPAITDEEALATCYLKAGELRRRACRPSEYCVWDTHSEQWVLDVAAARAQAMAHVNKEHSRRKWLPIMVGGVYLDADTVAQSNLSGKLHEVRERTRLAMPIPEGMLVWRDADNMTHSFSDMQTYYDWLASVTMAITERNTALYMAAWQRKEALSSMTTVEEILAYDISTGWPE